MADATPSRQPVFPKWSNLLLPALVVAALGTPAYLGILGPLLLSPTTVNVGYQPVQPVEYSHDLHAGQLGIDCRYCHTSVESSGFAAIPPTSTCMNCHHAIRTDSPKVAPILASYESGKPIEWVKVHDLPDYAYFNHSVHVNAGVSCVECHGRVDRMDAKGVSTVENLSMSWCLECHRNPEANLRPRSEVTNLAWGVKLTSKDIDLIADIDGVDVDRIGLEAGKPLTESQKKKIGAILAKQHHIKSARQLTDCSTCHR